MTQEQAQNKIVEIRRLLMERVKAAKLVDDIDIQIARLAEVPEQTRVPKSQRMSKNDFMAIARSGS